MSPRVRLLPSSIHVSNAGSSNSDFEHGLRGRLVLAYRAGFAYTCTTTRAAFCGILTKSPCCSARVCSSYLRCTQAGWSAPVDQSGGDQGCSLGICPLVVAVIEIDSDNASPACQRQQLYFEQMLSMSMLEMVEIRR